MYYYKTIVLFILLSTMGLSARAQQGLFSQYHLDPVYNSPGELATSDYVQLLSHYRSQSLARNQGVETIALSGIYPLYYNGGRRFGGIGLGVMTENSGAMGMLRESSVRAGYAYKLELNATHFLSIGLQGGYYHRAIDASKIRTEMQYQDGLPAPALPTGESFSGYASDAFKADAGVSWYVLDAYGEERFSLGASAFNVNRANYAFLSNTEEKLAPVRFQFHGTIRALRTDRFQMQPLFRYIYEQNNDQLNVGSLFLYNLQGGSTAIKEHHFGLGALYSLDNAVTLSMQLVQPAYVLSLSYDLPAAAQVEYAQVNNAVEISLGWRLNRAKKVKARTPISEIEENHEPVAEEEEKEEEVVAPSQAPEEKRPEPEVQQTEAPKAATEDVQEPTVDLAAVEERNISRQIEIVEETTLAYKGVGDTSLSVAAQEELDKIAGLLEQKPELSLKVVGHSCTIGGIEANKSISMKRATTAKEYLLLRGIAAERIEAEGKYFLEPIASNETEAGRQKNRRIEFVIIE